MEGFGEVVPKLQLCSQHCFFEGMYGALAHMPKVQTRLAKTRLRIWSQRDTGSKTTYWSSAMSSRVRVSNRERISASERTVRGILGTWSKDFEGRRYVLSPFDAVSLYTMPLNKLVKSRQGRKRAGEKV